MRNLRKGMLALLMAFGLLSFAAAQSPFNDVPPDHWAYEAIQKAVEKGILEGYPGNVFLGKRPITRYEAAIIVSRLIDAIEQTTGKEVKVIEKEGKKVDLEGYAQKDWISKKFASKKEFEEFKEMVNKLAAEFQDELEALGVRVSDLETRVSQIEEKVDSLGGVDISGEVQWRAFRGATEIGDLFRRNQPGANSGVDQWLKLNLKKATDAYEAKVSLWDRNWSCAFFCNPNQLGLIHRNGFGHEGSNQLTIAEAYVKIDTSKLDEDLGTITFGRQHFRWGPVGLIMDDPLNPYLPGAATWEYDLDKVKLIGLASIAPNSKNDRVIGGRAEFGLKKEGAVVGVSIVPFHTGSGENVFGVDAYLPLQGDNGAVYGEFVRWDQDTPGFDANNSFLIGADWKSGDKYAFSLKFADIDAQFNNSYTRFDEDEEGVYRKGFTGFGLSGRVKLSDKWSVYGDVNKGDSSSPTGWARATLERKVSDNIAASATFIQYGDQAPTKRSLLRGEVKVKF